MFNSVPVAASRYWQDSLPLSAQAFRRDTLTVGWEDRVRVRARRTSDQGFEFATALPRGTMLSEGDLLVFDAERVVVEVREQLELVFVIRPVSTGDWARIAYHIGNSHQPVMLAADAIVCADLPGMEQVLNYHAIPFVRERRAFTPLGQLPDHQHAVRA